MNLVKESKKLSPPIKSNLLLRAIEKYGIEFKIRRFFGRNDFMSGEKKISYRRAKKKYDDLICNQKHIIDITYFDTLSSCSKDCVIQCIYN